MTLVQLLKYASSLPCLRLTIFELQVQLFIYLFYVYHLFILLFGASAIISLNESKYLFLGPKKRCDRVANCIQTQTQARMFFFFKFMQFFLKRQVTF